ncbi:LPS assembly protein LptD [Paracoccus sp. S-4012]|uniref:LPS-assembly protein LptD n=1 Tax=Paracoccus sp. S-4012 TaxID=2665648 RepID=UPI0012B08DCA|nr:LPS assembly protein LptD [Paracoccus sp. S-4012]MRX51064.1 LPS assembly protein LptD [Paracoccus sp. S-4012]
MRGARRRWGGRLAALLVALALPAGALAQPALAPTDGALLPGTRADGTEAVVVPAAPASQVIEATPAAPVEDGTEATLLADMVTLSGNRRLEASGGVVVWYQGTRLIAPRVIYDGEADRLYIEGPIHLTRPGDRGTDREGVLVAEAAELDGDLRQGLMRGARLVLARELQLAADEVRVLDEGRVTVLDRVVASSCRVCAASPTPLWEIRARRITHDQDTRRLTFEQPQFRAFGVPILSLPGRITAPGPTVERMSGLLRPTLRTTSELGVGVKAPYFLTFGDSADLTLTPYLATGRTLTLEARYRQAFTNGALEWQGAVSRDDIREGETRGMSFGAAQFALSSGFNLGLQQQWVSDRDYLDDYGISDADRLWTGVTLERVREGELIGLRAGAYRTLREGEVQALLPTEVLDAAWIRRWQAPGIGGTVELGWQAHAHRRPSDLDVLGRDVARLSAWGGWQRSAVLPGGVLGRIDTRLDADLWRVEDDSTIRAEASRVVPTVAVELRWPLLRAGAGAVDVLEPVAQIAWSPRRDEDDEGIPNEDSRSAELDEGNLYALDRLPGRDRRETGLRAALGLTWTRTLADGTAFGAMAGRVWRDEDDPDLAGTPFEGRRSDWLLAANWQHPQGLAAVGRALFADGGEVSRADARLGILRPDIQLSAGYGFVDASAGTAERHQIAFDAGWQVAPGWWAEADTRYDLVLGRPESAALGVTYRNECITVAGALSRDWAGEGRDEPDTSFDFSVRLGGFGRASDLPGTVARRSCMR